MLLPYQVNDFDYCLLGKIKRSKTWCRCVNRLLVTSQQYRKIRHRLVELWLTIYTAFQWCDFCVTVLCQVVYQEAQLSPRDRTMRHVSCNLPTATQQCRNYLYDKSWTNRSHKLDSYTGTMCDKHVHSTMTRSSHFHCPIGVINKPTTGVLWISPVYRRLAVAKFSKSTMKRLLSWLWPRPLRKHLLITRLRLRMADPCTKFEVSSISRCGDITWRVKF